MAARPPMRRTEEIGMTIDLTGPEPQLLPTCDQCGQLSQLYQLIGTKAALCRGCFGKQHG